jgi:hypothetical protein
MITIKKGTTLLVGSALLAVMLSGCATVTRGSKEALVVESEPSGADVVLSTGQRGTTPTSFNVKRKRGLKVTISKPGYQTAEVVVTPQVASNGSLAMAGNVFIGGVVGMAIDASSGAMNELKPNPVKVKLNPLH